MSLKLGNMKTANAFSFMQAPAIKPMVATLSTRDLVITNDCRIITMEDLKGEIPN